MIGKYFAVKFEDDKRYPGFVDLCITRNGRQWTVANYTKEELAKIRHEIDKYLEGNK